MQTFMPYPSFVESAKCLDNKRLGKQRVECLQILKALSDPTYGWQNHPAVKMWRGYECFLCRYGVAICSEWKDRGFKDTCHTKIMLLMPRVYALDRSKVPWLGNQTFHDSHKSNLLRKDPLFYSQYGWNVPDNLPYYWPKQITP